MSGFRSSYFLPSGSKIPLTFPLVEGLEWAKTEGADKKAAEEFNENFMISFSECKVLFLN